MRATHALTYTLMHTVLHTECVQLSMPLMLFYYLGFLYITAR